MQKIKGWWSDRTLTELLATILAIIVTGLLIWAGDKVVELPEVYAKDADVKTLALVVAKAPMMYASKIEVQAHKKNVACDIKELSVKMESNFKDMGQKIDQNNQLVNEKIDKLMRIMLQERQPTWKGTP